MDLPGFVYSLQSVVRQVLQGDTNVRLYWFALLIPWGTDKIKVDQVEGE